MRNLTILAVFALAFAMTGWSVQPANGGHISIDFDDGTADGVAVGNFYSSLGITFIDAAWNDGFDGRPGTSSPFQLGSLSTSSLPKASNPIIGVFSLDVDMVSISAIDVGFNDARLDVYDAALGGNLLASSTFEGLSVLGNSGTPQDTGVLSVAVSGIRRIELYQPKSEVVDDGVLFDNLTYNVVPEPSTAFLFLAVSGAALVTRSRRPSCRRK